MPRSAPSSEGWANTGLSARAAASEPLVGLVERVTFHNPDNGFCVLRVKAKGQRDLVTVVGHAPTISAGEFIQASGSWVNDRTHGPQFKASFLRAAPPTTIEGIEKYLGSGMIKGIGPIYASKLVRAFGEAVFDVIEDQPERLREVEGIGPKRAERIIAEWADQKVIREIMIFLHSHGVSTSRAVRIFKVYGADAIQVLSENPYRLARDVRGIGFKTADAIAARLEIEKTAMIRARAGIGFTLTEAMDDGHCGLPLDELVRTAEQLLEIPTQIVEQALDLEIEAGDVVVDTVGDRRCIFLAGLHSAEHSSGFASLRRKLPCLGSTSSRRWMVLASRPVLSLSRLAARPVGAARAMSIPLAPSTFRMALISVVLPTPGPPVITRTLESRARREPGTPTLVEAQGVAGIRAEGEGDGMIPALHHGTTGPRVQNLVARAHPARDLRAPRRHGPGRQAARPHPPHRSAAGARTSCCWRGCPAWRTGTCLARPTSPGEGRCLRRRPDAHVGRGCGSARRPASVAGWSGAPVSAILSGQQVIAKGGAGDRVADPGSDRDPGRRPVRGGTMRTETTGTGQQGPLAGVTVLEFSMFMAGPTCGLMLADLGAEVFKIERIPGGDDTRRMTPPEVARESAAFMMMNRNKRGVAIDIKKPGGLRAIHRLAARAEIVIENFRPGTMARLGLGYEELAKDNPALVYGSVSGFGATGPLAERAGVDLVAQGFSGLMSITGEGPGRPPVKVGAPVSDTTAGMLLALAVVAAYSHRLRTGRGQRVETSLIEAAMAHTYWQSAIFLATGRSPGPMGSAHPLTSPYQAYACADGYIVLGAPNELNWQRLLEAIEAPELGADPRFADNARRLEHNAELTEAIEARLAARSRAAWIARLEAAGVPCGPVHSVGEALSHPHVRAREMVVEVEHPRAGRIETLGCPMKFSETPSGVRKAAPLYAEDTHAVLEAHGFDAAEIEALIEDGAIAVAEGLAAADGVVR